MKGNLIDKAARAILKLCINRLYSTKDQRDEFKRIVNNETWIGSMISGGGHSLEKSKPICDEEVVSVMCALRGMLTYSGNDSRTEAVDYYESKWKS